MRPMSWALLCAKEGLNLGQKEPMLRNGFVSRTVNHFGEGYVVAFGEG